jgi:ribosomal protein S18 acetylase RimI-like enzyme
MGQLLETSKGAVTVRPAVPGDAAPLRALRLEALANHPEAFAADHAATAAESVEAWAERIAEYAVDDKGVICVASVDGQLAGMTGLVRGRWPKTRHAGMIWGVYVAPDWRGLGVAAALLEECFAWARARGLVTLSLGVVTTNTPAIRCYARCGFGVYGVEPRVIYYGGVFHDELLMVRSI